MNITRAHRLMAFLLGLLIDTSVFACTSGIQMKVGQVVLDAPTGAASDVTTVNFRQTYSTAPLVFILPSDDNPDPSTIRVSNVTTTSFDVGTAESQGEDGVTLAEDFNYIAIEPGNYTVGGLQIQAGTITTTQRQSGVGGSTGYATINFAPAFPGGTAPIVIHEIQSFANDNSYDFSSTALTEPWLETVSLQSTFNNTGGQVALERAETSAGSVSSSETIAYLAITPGAGSFVDNDSDTVNINAFETADIITDSCTGAAHGLSGLNVIAVGSQSRRDGNNGGWIRQCGVDGTNLRLLIEEDRANDAEQVHTTESASIIAFDQPFDESGGSSPTWEADSATVDAQNVGGSVNFTTVSFPNEFESTPNIFSLPTDAGNAPASVRVRNVSTNGFQIAQFQPEGEVGAHPSMTVDYIAITPGTHAFPNGTTLLESGVTVTAASQSKFLVSSGSPINFTNSWTTPVLLLDLQSNSSEPGLDPDNPSIPWLETAVLSVTGSGAVIALERAETTAGSLNYERIAYLVAESGTDDSIIANGGANIDIKSMVTADNIIGVDNNNCRNTSFPGGAFAGTPLAVATQRSRDGADGGWVRRCNLNPAQIGLEIDEDRANDTERSHTSEIASVLAFSGSFEWCAPEFTVSKTSFVQRDPVNGLSNPKSIPGALQRYEVRVQNGSRVPIDSDSVVIEEDLTGNSVFVQSSVDYPEAPFVFTDGAAALTSGLGFSYGGPGDASDDVEFSANNGADGFTHTPVPDGDGFATGITDIRIRPSGVMNLYDGSNIPEFTMEFGIRVD